jgi:hypothetical protein
VTLVERKSGFTAIGLLARRAAPEVNARLRQLITAQPRQVRTIRSSEEAVQARLTRRVEYGPALSREPRPC